MIKTWIKLWLCLLLISGLGFRSYTAFGYSEKIRVLIYSTQREEEALCLSSPGRIKVFNYQDRRFIRGFTDNTKINCRVTSSGIEINGCDTKSNFIVLADAYRFPIGVGKRSYRGEIILYKRHDFRLDVINELDLELYIRGIMKQEISPEWPLACLKAQAIVARTYALHEKIRVRNSSSNNSNNNNKEVDLYYDLKATNESQLYLGLDGEDKRTDRAILDTAGMVLIYEGEPICAFYHACCGGHTESGDEIFAGSEPLKGVDCRFCQGSPYYRWQVIFPDYKIRNYLLRSEIKVGQVKALEPINLTSSGRIQELKIEDDLGISKIAGKFFRQIIGYDQLPSLFFDILEEGGAGEGINKKNFCFKGRGWGHGVGLCQWGAKKMAEQGYTCQEIMFWYYPLASLGYKR